MGKPKAPDPNVTAAAQTASNRETAIAQASLNMVDQTDAYGNKVKYSQSGTWSDGTPRFSATQTLSAPQQQLLNTGQATQQNLANLAQEQSGRLSGLLNEPLDWSAQQNYLNELTNSNLDPMWARQEEQFQQSLVNRGIRPGSTSYQQQLADFQNNKSNAYNSANLANFNTAQQSQTALRNQPLNEILALSGGSQIQSPQFTATPQTSVAGTDVAGITNQAYQTNLQGYNSMMGGLFSAGAGLLAAPQTSVLGGLLSDRRMKTDIKRIGTAFNGLPIYTYRYLDDDVFHIGFMADEVEKVHPEAVETGPDGFKRVFYSKAVA